MTPSTTRTIATIIATLALNPAMAQLAPPTCQGVGAQHDCRTATWELDPLGAAAATPTDPIATAALLLENGDATEARAHLMNALTTTPAEERAQMYFLLGIVESRLGDHEAAAQAFTSVQPPTFASRYDTALAQARAGNTQFATNLLSALLSDALTASTSTDDMAGITAGEELPPKTLDALQLILTTMAALQHHDDQPATAMTTLEQLFKVMNPTPELIRQHAIAAIEALPASGVVSYTQASVTTDDRDLLLGRAYAKAGMHEYATRHYRAAAKHAMNASDAQALAEIATYHAQQGDWITAVNTADETLRIDPTNHHARTILALELERRGDHAQAAREHQLVARHGGNPLQAHARAAVNLEAAGDHAAALAAAETALALAEQEDDTHTAYVMHTLMARTHYALGATTRALEHAQAAAATPHATADVHVYAGDLAMLTGDPETALTHYARADQHDPRVARGAYQANMLLERYEEARAAAEHLTGDAGEALYLIAWTYALQGDTASAYQAWSRAADADHQPAREIIARTK